MKEKIDMSLDRSLGELVSSYWEFKDYDEVTTEEEEVIPDSSVGRAGHC